jgi:leucyl aminopeptidase
MQYRNGAPVLIASNAKRTSTPIWLARDERWVAEARLNGTQKAWLETQGFKAKSGKHLLLPRDDGRLAGVVLGLGEERSGDPMDKAELAMGLLPSVLPSGVYHLACSVKDPELAAIAWGLGA